MRKLSIYICVAFAAFACANAALAYQSPGNPTGFVNDFAKLFTVEQKAALENKIGNFERPAGVQFSVVTVLTLGDETIETYAVRLFEEWGIGQERKDNGLLLLVAPTERQVRIEVGYGLEGTITDAQSSTIIRSTLTPAFKEGKYYEGIDGAVDQLIGLVEGDPTITTSVNSASQNAGTSRDYSELIVFALILGANLLGIMARTKSWWLGGVVGFIGGLIFISLVGALIAAVVGLIIDFLLSRYGGNIFKGPGGNGPHFWFLGGGPRGGGGGFGGFGGGRSGGGGASGSW